MGSARLHDVQYSIGGNPLHRSQFTTAVRFASSANSKAWIDALGSIRNPDCDRLCGLSLEFQN